MSKSEPPKKVEDHPQYSCLREFKKKNQWELMRKYGAHGLGIGWKKTGKSDEERLALLIYVEPGQGKSSPTIPSKVVFVPEGAQQPTEIETEVVESPAAAFEADG